MWSMVPHVPRALENGALHTFTYKQHCVSMSLGVFQFYFKEDIKFGGNVERWGWFRGGEI